MSDTKQQLYFALTCIGDPRAAGAASKACACSDIVNTSGGVVGPGAALAAGVTVTGAVWPAAGTAPTVAEDFSSTLGFASSVATASHASTFGETTRSEGRVHDVG